VRGGLVIFISFHRLHSDLKRSLNDIGIGRRQCVLGWKTPVRPRYRLISRCDGRQLNNQFLPQDSGLIGVERRLWGRRMALTAALTIGAIYSNLRRRLAVGLNRTVRFQIRTKVGRIEIVFSGDPDQRE
jgi:hypothetical protein